MGGGKSLVQAELVSADPAASLEAIRRAGIAITQLTQWDDLTSRFWVSRRDYQRLKKLCDQRGVALSAVSRRGTYWVISRLRKRPVLLLGLALLLLIYLYLPTRVLFVEVEGNQDLPRRQILAAAEECGIRFWASRREVRSEKVKNALLSALPQLQWAGVNTSGCLATVSVRERAIPETDDRPEGIVSLAAARDGYLLTVTATEGTPLVQPGQTVREGQTLISGYTDCGICIRAGQAEGEVFAQTKRRIRAVTPAEFTEQRPEKRELKKISLLLGKKRINLWKDSGISDTSCGRMYEEYYVTLPGGFRLPVAVCADFGICYESTPAELTQQQAQEALEACASAYLHRQMLAGQITAAWERIEADGAVFALDGDYLCTEMIAVRRQEQIGDTNGKND